MKYILKNIKSFAKDYTKIFVLLIITISASTLIIHLSYGMFREYKDRSELSKSVTNRIDLKLKSSYSKRIGSDTSGTFETMGDLNSQIYDRTADVRDVTVQDVKKFAKELDFETANKLLNVQTGILQGKYRFETNFLIAKGKITNSAEYGFDSLYNFTFGYQTTNTFQYGRYFSDEEYSDGKKVCIMYGFQKNLRGEYLEKKLSDDGTVIIDGEKYKIIGLQNGIGTGYIPITAVKGESVLLDKITFQFKDNISLREVNLLLGTAKKVFGDSVDAEYKLVQSDENGSFYSTVLILIVMVSMVAAFNFCALYHYILMTRRRTLNILRICGLSYSKSMWLYLGECSILSVVTYFVTVVLFRFVLMPFLSGKVNVFDFHYKMQVYVILFIVWYLSSFLLQYVMIRWNLKKMVVIA
ncbi:MAG: FtsX-like permease family protein [Christensenellales bacterium]